MKTAKVAKRAAGRGARKPTVSAATMARLIREGKVPAHYAVAKADGDGAVNDWIELLPGWQSVRAGRVDAVVTRQAPNVHKAVKWHGLWYGIPGGGWFLAIASFKAHLKLVFFDGASLRPLPPTDLATKPQRALDVREADKLDEAQLAGWVKQASRLPGWGRA